MNSDKPLIVKRSSQSTEKTKRRFQPLSQSATEPVQHIDVEQPEQPEPVIQLQSIAEPPIDQSIYGSGWSVAELMTEFSGRFDG